MGEWKKKVKKYDFLYARRYFLEVHIVGDDFFAYWGRTENQLGISNNWMRKIVGLCDEHGQKMASVHEDNYKQSQSVVRLQDGINLNLEDKVMFYTFVVL